MTGDARWMRAALRLAENGLCSAAPNPRVGCVLVRDGAAVGAGVHLKPGAPHAEVMALQKLAATSSASSDADSKTLRNIAAGAAAYVNLAPCAHQGRTPPCTSALLEAGVSRIVIAAADPNPAARGGVEKLRAGGVEVACGVLAREAVVLNRGFYSRFLRGRPWVRLKIAATMDGRTALSSGLSQWITGAAARRDAHRMRARSCAVMTGIGTALADNPQLTARDVPCARQPLRVLVDARARFSPTMNIAKDKNFLLATAVDKKFDGVEQIVLPDEKNEDKVDLRALLQFLALREVNELTVEAGRKLCGAFLEAGLADEIVVYCAPRIFGEDAAPMFAARAMEEIDDAPPFCLISATRLGEDVKNVYFARGAIDDLLSAARALEQ